ncbi:MAG: hypothetical protein ABJB86_10905 [Bacteroidota bacterium]
MRIVKSISIKDSGNHAPAGPTILQTKIQKHDMVQNIHFPEAMVRFGFTLLIPMVMLGIDKRLIIYTAPLIVYLFITALARFCIVKYAWHRYVKHEPVVTPAYGQDPDFPEESAD